MLQQLTKKQKLIGIIIITIIIITVIAITIVYNIKEESVIDLNQLIQITEENKTNDIKAQNITKSNNLNLEENKNSNELKEKEESEKNENFAKAEDEIIVHITGEVKKTGILKLKEGARIADAIQAAGGKTSEADLDSINLAYELQDGQKIYIPNRKDKIKNEEKVYITSESGNNVIKDEKSNNTIKKGGNKKVNINTANQEELETLPGIGTSIANKIIEYRNENGKFQNIEDIQNVKGIGNSKYTNIKEHITVK